MRTDGSQPTITPGALLAAAGARRIIVPLEKILLHALPIHRMVFPASLTDKELASMAGNTMHVEIVAVAMMFALVLVDWTSGCFQAQCLPCPRAGGPAGHCQPREDARNRRHKCVLAPLPDIPSQHLYCQMIPYKKLLYSGFGDHLLQDLGALFHNRPSE